MSQGFAIAEGFPGRSVKQKDDWGGQRKIKLCQSTVGSGESEQLSASRTFFIALVPDGDGVAAERDALGVEDVGSHAGELGRGDEATLVGEEVQARSVHQQEVSGWGRREQQPIRAKLKLSIQKGRKGHLKPVFVILKRHGRDNWFQQMFMTIERLWITHLTGLIYRSLGTV